MKKLSFALAKALGVGLAVSAATAPAYAQQDQTQTAQAKEKIEVTGTSIKRVEGETALPVTVLSRDEIEKSGATTPMELLNYISANNSLGGVALTSTIGATTNSAQLASLRGLQGAHTLVLINGKRVNGFSGETQGVQGVNLAIIPFNAIERVEILKDGASAVYGSDAIAGVINFIMRSDYKGAEASAYYGAPTRSGGGAEEKYAASLGFGDLNKNRYNVFFNASYDHQKPLDQKDRNFSNNSTDRFLEQLGGFAGSSNTFPGNITTGHIGIIGSSGTNCGPNPYNIYVPDFGIGCSFDPAQQPGVESIPEDKNTNFFLQGKFQITPTWQAYAHALYGEDKNRFIIQGAPISSVFSYGPNGDIPATITWLPSSPFYPHAAAAAAGVDGQPLNVRWRTTPLGNRDTTDTNTGSQLVGGLTGTIADRWDTDVSYSYAQGKTVEHTNGGFFLYSKLIPILNSGNIDLSSYNLPADQLALLHQSDFIGDVFTGKSSTGMLNAKVSGDLFNMPAGTAAGAIGIDYRKEKLDETPSDAYLNGDITGYGGSSGAIHGSRDVKAAYGEVNLPLLSSLELDAAIRTDDYSDFGRTNNPKFSLRFQPNRDMLFRTSYGKGFLAPSLYQLDLPNISGVSQTGLSDPIRCPVTNNTGIDCVTQFGLTFGGNHALQPETSEQATFGVVLEPTNAFSVSADYFKIRLNNEITNGIPVTTILGDLATYGSLVTRGAPDPAFPNLPGRIVSIDQTYLNIGATHIEGIDLEAHYKWPQMRYGRLRFDISGTYYTRYDFQNLDKTYSGFVGTAFGSVVVGVIPRWKHYATLSWDAGPWSTTVANTYQTSYTDWQTDYNGNERTVGSMSLWDLQEQYTGIKHWTLTLGVKNVLDTNPPATNQQNTFQVGYDPSYYDARARFVYGTIKYEFR
ncbi:MAG TPA: TonB-dependent receptor [Usitatibacter sp.]|nr:TonB-dependent receptor [Usitatibacter sp.]